MAVSAATLRMLVEVPLQKSDGDLQPFLDAASLVRSEDLAGSGLSSERLDLIEQYLAAHFFIVFIERGGLIQTGQVSAKDNYRQVKDSLQGLASTAAGQQALALDTSGTLQAKLGSDKATLTFVSSYMPPRYWPRGGWW